MNFELKPSKMASIDLKLGGLIYKWLWLMTNQISKKKSIFSKINCNIRIMASERMER